MRFSKYNHEGYHDPTVYEAFTGIEKERKQEKQAVSSCGQAMPSTGLSCISVPLTRAT